MRTGQSEHRNLLTAGAAAGFNHCTHTCGVNVSEKARFMTALAAKFEAFDSTRFQVLALLLASTFALLSSLALTGNLLLRYP